MSFRNWLIGKCKMTMRDIVYTLPPPLPREGGRMPPHRTRMPLSRIRHFERKREIFFVRGKAKDVRGTTSGKHRTPCAPEERCFMQTDSRMKQKMANEKDPSAALGITIRANAPPARLFSPLRCQPPPLRGTSFHGKEVVCRFSVSSSISCVSHPLAAPSSSGSVRGVSSQLLRRR